MKETSAIEPWFLFYRARLLTRIEISFVRKGRRIDAQLKSDGRGFNCSATGRLLDSPFTIEALSRRRLDGDTSDSIIPLFEGSFKHENGASGNFTAKPRIGGELLRMGVYGADPQICACKLDPEANVCPVEVYGIPGLRVRFEEPPFTPRHLFSANQIPKPPGPACYSGVAIPETDSDDAIPPAVAVLTALVFCYHGILTAYYVKDHGAA